MNICMKAYLIIILFLICCVHTGFCGYTVTSGEKDNQNAYDLGGNEVHPFQDVPLWIKISFTFALVAGLLAAVKFFPPLAGRIKSVLDNKKRQKVLDYISENPGESIEEIAAGMNIKRDTLRYHLKCLKNGHYIVIENTDNSRRIFPNQRSFSGVERKIISLCHNPMQLKIIALIAKYPGIRNTELKEELDISKSAVSWHTARLENAGLLSCRKSGKSRHYYIKSGLEEILIDNFPDEIKADYDFSKEEPLPE